MLILPIRKKRFDVLLFSGQPRQSVKPKSEYIGLHARNISGKGKE